MTQFTRRVAAAGAAALALTISMGASTATASHEAPARPDTHPPGWRSTPPVGRNTVQSGRWARRSCAATETQSSLPPGPAAPWPPSGAHHLGFPAGTGSQGVGLSGGGDRGARRKNSSGESCSPGGCLTR